MKNINRKSIGILLVAGVIIFGATCQWLGPGLIVTGYPILPPELVAQGVTAKSTGFNFALMPLVILGIIGLVLAMIPRRGA